MLCCAQALKLQAANGFSQEDSGMIIEGMASQGAEPTYCMGDDIPLPVLSSRPHQLGDYFKQRFAQARALPQRSLSEAPAPYRMPRCTLGLACNVLLAAASPAPSMRGRRQQEPSASCPATGAAQQRCRQAGICTVVE
jgi:hypothetical protein